MQDCTDDQVLQEALRRRERLPDCEQFSGLRRFVCQWSPPRKTLLLLFGVYVIIAAGFLLSRPIDGWFNRLDAWSGWYGGDYYPLRFVHGVTFAVLLANALVLWWRHVVAPRAWGDFVTSGLGHTATKAGQWAGRILLFGLAGVWAYTLLSLFLPWQSAFTQLGWFSEAAAENYIGAELFILAIVPAILAGYWKRWWFVLFLLSGFALLTEGILHSQLDVTISANVRDFADLYPWLYFFGGMATGALILVIVFRGSIKPWYRLTQVTWIMVMAHMFWWITPPDEDHERQHHDEGAASAFISPEWAQPVHFDA